MTKGCSGFQIDDLASDDNTLQSPEQLKQKNRILKRVLCLLCFELIAFFFAAPYIILLALDPERGLFDNSFSDAQRLWCYALLVGFYPLLQSIVAPFVGKRLDNSRSSVSVLRSIHLANCICYCLLAVAAYYKSFFIALVGLSIPGVIGCASPVGKTLIAAFTLPENRTREFAKLAFIKGLVKLLAPLAGVAVFTMWVNEQCYFPLFAISALFSGFCFLLSFRLILPKISKNPSQKQICRPALTVFTTVFRQNFSLIGVFVLLLTGYVVFVKYIPFVCFQELGQTPSLINYFSSVVGLAYCVNQFVASRFTHHIESKQHLLFFVLSASCLLLALPVSTSMWFTLVFTTLFSFSVLATCVEAKLSLQGLLGAPGTVQGVLYSFENWCYLLAPFIGSGLATMGKHYPLYFALAASCIATLIYSGVRVKERVNMSKSA